MALGFEPVASPGALLEIEDLSVRFATDAGDVPAVRGVSLSIAPGETAALVGESGCGKTVTAFSILRLISGGAIRFDGRDLVKLSEPQMREVRGREIGMTFQEPMTSLNPVITIGKQLAEVLTLHRGMDEKAARQEVVELLGRVGIPSPDKRVDQYPHEFSGGMKQRVLIAMALACRPKLLIADEPTTALDVTIQAQILALLRSLQAEFKMAILLITHDLGVVAHFAEHVHVMYAGKIVERAKTADLFASPLHPYTRALLGALPGHGKKKQPLEAIPGRVPAPLALPPGCAFSARCKFVMERCPNDLPELREKDGEHSVACWLHEAVTP